MGASQHFGYSSRDPHNKDYSISGSILRSPYYGKLPHAVLKLIRLFCRAGYRVPRSDPDTQKSANLTLINTGKAMSARRQSTGLKKPKSSLCYKESPTIHYIPTLW